MRIIEALKRGAAGLNDVMGCVRREERGGERGKIGAEQGLPREREGGGGDE